MTIEYQAPGNLHGAYNTGPQTVTLGWDAAVDGVPLVFHSSGTYTSDPTSDHVKVTIIAPGGGGGSGHATQRIGSYAGLTALAGGGGGGGYASFTLASSFLLSTESINVGTGGAGGAGVATSPGGNIGNAGSDGSGQTTFGSHASTNPGHGGPSLSTFNPGILAAGGSGVVADVNATSVVTETGGAGGSAGGDVVPGNTTHAGAGGGTGGSTNSGGGIDPNPSGGTATNSGTQGGNGGAGGVASHGVAAAAPNGSLYGGGGGAGGSAESLNPATGVSGSGGAGANGVAFVTTFWAHAGPPVYGIFRDGVLIGSTTDTTFEDLTPLSGTHAYTVEVIDVDNNPMSPVSNSINISIALASYFYFGKFDPDVVYVPILLTDVKGIKPRIYMPLENTTVRTRR